MMGFIGVEWEQHLISELDSALNKWLDAIPNHCQFFTHFSCETLICYSALGSQPIEPIVLQPSRVSL
jgi:hypothetical protein